MHLKPLPEVVWSQDVLDPVQTYKSISVHLGLDVSSSRAIQNLNKYLLLGLTLTLDLPLVQLVLTGFATENHETTMWKSKYYLFHGLHCQHHDYQAEIVCGFLLYGWSVDVF